MPTAFFECLTRFERATTRKPKRALLLAPKKLARTKGADLMTFPKNQSSAFFQFKKGTTPDRIFTYHLRRSAGPSWAEGAALFLCLFAYPASVAFRR